MESVGLERGCPRGCIGYEAPPKPQTSGLGAMGGVIGGGALGLIGGPVGVVVGAVLGGVIGHYIERSSLSSQKSDLEREEIKCAREGRRAILFVE